MSVRTHILIPDGIAGRHASLLKPDTNPDISTWLAVSDQLTIWTARRRLDAVSPLYSLHVPPLLLWSLAVSTDLSYAPDRGISGQSIRVPLHGFYRTFWTLFRWEDTQT